MKKILICFSIFIFIFAKCKKDKIDSNVQYFGTLSAVVNGNTVNYNKANGGLLYGLKDSIYLNFEKWDGLILKENISIQKIFININTQQRIHKYDYSISRLIKLSSAYNTRRDDGDVICDVYNIYEPDSLQNHITITSYNPQTKEVNGTFQATYLIDSTRVATIGKCRSTAPDTIRIKNGQFHTKVL